MQFKLNISEEMIMAESQKVQPPPSGSTSHVATYQGWHLYEQLKAQIPRSLDHDEYSRRLRQAAEKAGV